MTTKFDVAIIGSGPSGIFAAYELISKNENVNVVMIEEGRDIYTRKCPIAEKKVNHCIKCNPCGIMRGFGGAGAFSDGKYNFTTEFGGWLSDYIADQEVLELIAYVDQINMSYGAPSELFSTKNSGLRKQALAYDLHLLDAQVRHLGTENNLEILKSIYEFLKEKVKIIFNTRVQKIRKEGDRFRLDIGQPEWIDCDYLIAAPGRAGSELFANQCKELGLGLYNNQVDVGVRVEIPAEVFQHITDEVYEAKLVYRTKQYGDLVRTFCMNPKGYVVAENTDGIVTVNGHSYRDEKLHSKNTNFALLVSNRFTEPFNEPHQYGKRIASFSNLLSGGVLVQRFGDLVKGRRTNEHRLSQSFTKPTLKATPGDLSLVLPKRHLDNIVEMIYALDKIAPGVANNDTLLYGVEVKFYSSRLKLTKQLETEIPNMFAVGDGAGVTRGLSQASASGVHVARIISERRK
ncbi:FAD-dependent oxidoreductase [Heliobacillus mobilis]|uniref:FAD-dependent oxidoreductase n=1 Tax=Heliobacterium mobile TaxID=28064 RepID=A0A6I3SH61_HELMO|nr:NAD(P)/FAD-dependent oxidoreductase [Heliobacterium mobile]MTV48168.1 FAD-dependent oxidoreductase [Heliobacterium mobile]